MICPKCHNNIHDGSKFCSVCGNNLQFVELICPHCHTKALNKHAFFCHECGHSLGNGGFRNQVDVAKAKEESICIDCHSIIPADSHYCPDCGQKALNTEDIHCYISELVKANPMGYKYLVQKKMLPPYKYAWQTEDFVRIVLRESDIIKKQRELEVIRLVESVRVKLSYKITHILGGIKNQKDDPDTRSLASSIVKEYPKGYEYYVQQGKLPKYRSDLLLTECESIISNWEDIIKKHEDIVMKENSEKKLLALYRQRARELVLEFPKGYKYYVENGKIPAFTSTSSKVDCESIIIYRYEISHKHAEIEKEENISQARKEAILIATTYAEGYEHFVKKGILRSYNRGLSISNIYRIIDYKAQIVKKQKEIDKGIEAEKKKEEEQRIRTEAARLSTQYSKGYEFYVALGELPVFTNDLRLKVHKRIVAKKDDIIKKHQELVEEHITLHEETNPSDAIVTQEIFLVPEDNIQSKSTPPSNTISGFFRKLFGQK